MPNYRIVLKRVAFAEVIVEAKNAREAREKVEADAHDYFMNADIGGTDTTSIVSVKPEKQAD